MTGYADDSTKKLPAKEYQSRLERIQSEMARRRFDVLLLTSADNVIYATGFDSPTWINLARPRYCIIPATGDIVFVVPATNKTAVQTLTWVADIRSWVSPNPTDDGVSLAISAVRSFPRLHGKIGVELGPQSRMGIPIQDFLRIREEIGPESIQDADGLIRDIRKIKSPFEVEAIKSAAQATSRAFAALTGHLSVGCSEVDAVRTFRRLLFAEGIESAPYLVAESGIDGYPSLQMAATDRRLVEGSVLSIDAGCCQSGYFCDFNRNYAFAKVSDRIRHINELLWEATEAGLRAAVPGARAHDVWRAQAAEIDKHVAKLGARRAENGRMGHGIGLRLTEPPSIHPDDQTVLAPGMVITIEPAVEFAVSTKDGSIRRMLIQEENLVVTEGGPLLLSSRGPREFFEVR